MLEDLRVFDDLKGLLIATCFSFYCSQLLVWLELTLSADNRSLSARENKSRA